MNLPNARATWSPVGGLAYQNQPESYSMLGVQVECDTEKTVKRTVKQEAAYTIQKCGKNSRRFCMRGLTQQNLFEV